MNYKLSTTITLFFIFLLSNGLIAQQALLSTGGNSTDGNISFSFGQFAYETFFSSSSSVSQGVQHPFEIDIVPSLFSLSNTIIHTGDIICFNALQNITVAGDGQNVIIQNNAEVNFIAGKTIRFLPGFSAVSGSVVHGYITTDNNFCDGYLTSSILQNPEVKGIEISEKKADPVDLTTEMQVKVYPNPNSGSFKIDLIHFENSAVVRIYNLIGEVLYTTELNKTLQHEINISNLRNGIYFVKVSCNHKQFVKKIIVN